MRQEKIQEGAVAANGTVKGSIARGHMNGLLFFGGDPLPDTAKVTIKRTVPGKCIVLAADVELRHFRRISELEYGATGKTNAGELLRLAMVTDPDGAGAKVAQYTGAEFKSTIGDTIGPQDVEAFFLDLGSIYLAPDNVLEYHITFPSAVGDCRIYAVSMTRRPDHMLQYDVLQRQEQHLAGIRSVYLSADTVGSLLTADASGLYTAPLALSVQIEDEAGGWITDAAGLVAAATVLGRTESRVQSQAVEAYQTPDGVPSAIYFKLSGADATKVAAIAVRVLFHQPSTSANTVQELRRVAAKVEAIEATDPDTARGLRHAGVVPGRAEELKQAALSVSS